MAGFLYYLPGYQSTSVQELAQLGLGHAFDDRSRLTRRSGKGPDGAEGLLVSSTAEAKDLRYDGDRQQWRKVAGSHVWVGLWTDDRPTPAELARPDQVDGHMIELGDGNRWLVPVAHSQVRADALPRTLVLSDDGESVAEKPLEAFEALSKAAERVFDQFRRDAEEMADETSRDREGAESEEHTGLSRAEAYWIAVRALQTNYRVAGVEVSMLDLVRTDKLLTEDGILGALIDLPVALQVAEELQKKDSEGESPTADTQGGSSTRSGSEGSSPTTDPPTPTGGGSA